MKKTILLIISILMLTQIAYAGVTNPLPTELNLLQGESGRFKFQIQTVASNQETECNYFLQGESPLLVEFDPAIIVVPAGQAKDVYGTVTVPSELSLGTYEAEFCISCNPTSGQEGAVIAVETCGLPITVNVVTEDTREIERENMNIPPKPFVLTTTLIILIIVGILIIAAIVYLLLNHLTKYTKKKK